MWKSVFIEATALLALIFGGYYVKTAWLTPVTIQPAEVAALFPEIPAGNVDQPLKTDSFADANPVPSAKTVPSFSRNQDEATGLGPNPASANSGIAKLVKAKRKIAKSLHLNGSEDGKFVIVSVSGVTKRVPVHVCGAPIKSAHKISISGASQPAPRSMIVQ